MAMEGERILSVLKKRSENFESISKDVKVVKIAHNFHTLLCSFELVRTFSLPHTDVSLSYALRKEAKERRLGV